MDTLRDQIADLLIRRRGHLSSLDAVTTTLMELGDEHTDDDFAEPSGQADDIRLAQEILALVGAHLLPHPTTEGA